VVDLELASLGAQIGFWSGGTGEIFAFDASKGDEGLIQYSCDIDHAEDVMPHLEIIIKLFREYHSK